MRRTRRTFGMLMIAALAGLAPIRPLSAEPTDDDLRLLGLMYRNRLGEYREGGEANPEILAAIAEIAAEKRAGATRSERYRAATRALTLLRTGEWNEGLELATRLDMRLSAKTFEPGETVGVRIEPVFDSESSPEAEFAVALRLVNSDGGGDAMASASAEWRSGSPLALELGLPVDLKPGPWRIEYSLTSPAQATGPILAAGRTIFVTPKLKTRLADLSERFEEIGNSDRSGWTPRHDLGFTALRWHLETQLRARREDVPGAYGGHPIFMTSMLEAAGMVQQRMDFTGELAFAEELASRLAAGEDPLAGRTGDMRLAYISPEDQEVVPFRVFLPPNFSIYIEQPVVIALHGAGGDENTYMDGFGGSFKRLAAERGYAAVSPNGRGPYSMYVGKASRDALDVLDVLRKWFRVNEEYICLTGHSMGGMGTLRIGLDNPGTFAALAPVAGFASTDSLKQYPMMPLLICAGGKDALVPVESARALNRTAAEAGMKNLKYIEIPDAGHTDLPERVMKDVFDWFDAHRKG